MITLFKNGAYLLNGTEVIEDTPENGALLQSKLGQAPSKEDAAKQTMAYHILSEHNTADSMDKLKIKFDKRTSHDLSLIHI